MNIRLFDKSYLVDIVFVTTLALGLQPRQGLTKVWTKYEAHESNFMLPGVQKNVREWTLAFSSEFSLWELEVQWTPEFSESDCKGHNPLDWGVPCIIESSWNVDA